MVPKLQSRKFAAVALAAAVLLSGCVGGPLASDDMTAKEIGEKAQQKYESIESYEGKQVRAIESSSLNQTTTANLWVKPHTGEQRVEYLAPSSMARSVVVSNESMVWSYNASQNVVRKTDLSGTNDTLTTTNYSRIFENVFENYDIAYDGTASVGDRSTYVLELTPKGNGSTNGVVESWRLWIDQDRWFPVKNVMTTSVGNETMTVTTKYTELSFNTDISEERFEYEPPADAKVVTNTMPEMNQFSSVGEANAATSFGVNAPQSLPDGYELVRATVTASSEHESVSLQYEKGSNSLFVSQTNRTIAFGGTDAETVTVSGHEANYDTYGNTHSVSWTCGGQTYSVSGSLSKSAILDVASSIDCE